MHACARPFFASGLVSHDIRGVHIHVCSQSLKWAFLRVSRIIMRPLASVLQTMHWPALVVAFLPAGQSPPTCWTYQHNERISVNPAVSAGKVFFTSPSRSYYAVDAATGKGSRLHVSLVRAGNIYYARVQGCLYSAADEPLLERLPCCDAAANTRQQNALNAQTQRAKGCRSEPTAQRTCTATCL